jgi:hypothetical protein
MMFGHPRTPAVLSLVIGFVLCAIVHAARLSKNAPEIFSIDPGEGPAGTVVKMTGSGFQSTRYVLFAAGRTGQQAKFKVLSDKELEVTAPIYLREGTSATVVVVTSSGAAVGVPASVLEVDHRQHGGRNTATFYHVFNGGVLDSSAGVVLVDEGGQASAHDASAICFVKNNGTLLNAERFSGLVIHEPGANLQTGPQPYNPSTRLLKVPVITASVGVEPFIYQRAEVPRTRAESPPEVKGLLPNRVPRGGVVTLRGKGFSETSEVLFVAAEHAANGLSAEYRIVSNSVLEVEVPDLHFTEVRLVVINPKGATLVVAQNDLSTFRRSSNRTESRAPGGRVSRTSHVKRSAEPATLVGSGATVKVAGTRGVYIVEKGGRVTHTGGSCAYFVKNGGTVDGSGGRAFVVREPEAAASVAAAGKNAESDREVESLSLSVVPAMFDVVAP